MYPSVKMLCKSILSVTLLFLYAESSHSQPVTSGSAFVSANAGAFVVSHKDFGDMYGSNRNLAFGVDFGYPLTEIIHLYGKLTYFSNSGVPVRYFRPFPGYRELDGSARYRQMTGNAGLQFRAIDFKKFVFAIQGGLSYAIVRERIRIEADRGIPESTNVYRTGAYGFFGGLGLERRLGISPFSTFFIIQYNIIHRHVTTDVGNFSGLNLSLGLRYHI